MACVSFEGSDVGLTFVTEVFFGIKFQARSVWQYL